MVFALDHMQQSLTEESLQLARWYSYIATERGTEPTLSLYNLLLPIPVIDEESEIHGLSLRESQSTLAMTQVVADALLSVEDDSIGRHLECRWMV